MNMNIKTLAGWGIALVTAGFLGGAIASQNAGESKAAPATPSQDDMMAAWEKYKTPGSEQAWLAERVGKWNVTSKQWEAPGQPPVESTMTAQIDMILGGRFRFEHLVGTSFGMPFEGSGVVGYDNATKKFVLSWIDNFGTGIANGSGTRSADGKTLTMEWSMTNPVSGELMNMRSVETIEADGRVVFEMYSPLPDGTQSKTLELTYTRAK